MSSIDNLTALCEHVNPHICFIYSIVKFAWNAASIVNRVAKPHTHLRCKFDQTNEQHARARSLCALLYILPGRARWVFGSSAARTAPPAKVILNMHKIYIHRTHTISFLALSAYDVFGWWLNVQKKEEEIKTLGYGVCLPLHKQYARALVLTRALCSI